jgi:ATP-binding cassette subfamily F protein 3
LRSLLGCFLFSGEDVFKPLGVLSGGERNRYALARLLVSPANFLLLDEPTNHLDMRAKEVLLEAIRNFTGTVVFVSHDRAFIDALATRVFEIRDGAVHVYTGNYEDYLWQISRQAEVATKTPAPDSSKKSGETLAPPQPDPSSNGQPVENASAKRVSRINPIRLRQMQDRCNALEEEIPRIEAAIQTTEEQLAIYVSAEHYQSQQTQLDQMRADHTAMLTEWEELVVQLEEQAAISSTS